MSHMYARCRSLVLAVCLVGLGGCSAGGLVQIRPERLYERFPSDTQQFQRVGDLDIRRSSFLLFGIPVSLPNLVGAVESEIQTADADAVSNLGVEVRFQSIMFLLAWTRYRVTGDLLRQVNDENGARP